MATAKCPACGLSLGGVPETRRVLVTCPSAKGGCGSKFYFPPTERSVIAMRCAKDGRSFNVSFKRDTDRSKFTVERIVVAAGGVTNGPADSGRYNADSYDITGFYCPCCGYAPGAGEGSFVCCGTCHQLVCQGLSYSKLDGASNTIQWYVCYPQCGGEGPIVGVIQEFDASRSSTMERAPVARLASGAPPPLKLGKG